MHTINGITYLDTRETARRLSLNMRTLSNQRCEERSPMRYINYLGRVLYPQSEVDAYASRLER